MLFFFFFFLSVIDDETRCKTLCTTGISLPHFVQHLDVSTTPLCHLTLQAASCSPSSLNRFLLHFLEHLFKLNWSLGLKFQSGLLPLTHIQDLIWLPHFAYFYGARNSHKRIPLEGKSVSGLQQTSKGCGTLKKYSLFCGYVITANVSPAAINKTVCTSVNCMRQLSISVPIVHVYKPVFIFRFIFQPLRNMAYLGRHPSAWSTLGTPPRGFFSCCLCCLGHAVVCTLWQWPARQGLQPAAFWPLFLNGISLPLPSLQHCINPTTSGEAGHTQPEFSADEDPWVLILTKSIKKK